MSWAREHEHVFPASPVQLAACSDGLESTGSKSTISGTRKPGGRRQPSNCGNCGRLRSMRPVRSSAPAELVDNDGHVQLWACTMMDMHICTCVRCVSRIWPVHHSVAVRHRYLVTLKARMPGLSGPQPARTAQVDTLRHHIFPACHWLTSTRS